MHKRQDRQSLV